MIIRNIIYYLLLLIFTRNNINCLQQFNLVPYYLTTSIILITTHVPIIVPVSSSLQRPSSSTSSASSSSSSAYGVPNSQMESWASKFASPLYNFAQSITKYNELHGRFQNSRDSTVSPVDSSQALRQILASFTKTFEEKFNVLTKTANWAEERAKDFYMNGRAPKKFNYVNSKRINDEVEPEKKAPKWNYTLSLDTKIKRQFSSSVPVNTSVSTVHVPTTTYELDPTLMSVVNWTSDLDTRFIKNFEEFPTLTSQYFCSASGMLRQFPGLKWPFGTSSNLQVDQDNIDVYDCRMRPWYIGAASSHKSVLILIDTSGSMTGLRNKIARHVAFTILETLTDNDKMAVLNFNNDTAPVVACFEHRFVDATPENIRSVKQGLKDHIPQKFINITYALEKGFDMFSQEPSACNKAIFLIIDGSPSNNREIIKVKQNDTNQVRIFTYLIGREATDAVNVQDMSCNNNGYFSHLSTLSQVQEQVLKYIPVMSRPLVFSITREFGWTPIYVNQIVQPHINPAITSDHFEYMISTSLPVHETHHQRNNNTKTETKVQFLGVVGTDIPLRNLHILSNPFSIGTNGYTFLITNNGHVVFHPRWTPHVPKSDEHDVEILKPNYQAMDIGEIEIVDNDETWRNNDSTLTEMRYEMLLNQEGSKKRIKIRIPQDQFRRITIRTQNYDYSRIPSTPYSLAVVVQDGMNQFIGRFSLSDEYNLDVTSILSTISSGENEVTGRVSESNSRKDKLYWGLNPKWLYCEYLQSESIESFDGSPELELLHILNQLTSSSSSSASRFWSKLNDWDFSSILINNGTNENIRCNKELVESFIFDANVTEVFKSNKLWNFNEKDHKSIQKYGIQKTFLTTRSGLTRWVEFESDNNEDLEEIDPLTNKTIDKFSEITSFDSIYYQRAIDHNSLDPNSFVYTISSSNPNQLVASRAVYTNRNGQLAPVAVVGLLFNTTQWASRFFDVTNTVCITGDNKNCKYSCRSSEFDCFILDDNGYIVVAEDEADNGKFFGEIHSGAMEGLINANIYRRVEFYDYQSICFAMSDEEGSAGNILSTPFVHMYNLWTWLWAKLSFILIQFVSNGIFAQEDADDYDIIHHHHNNNATESPSIISGQELLSLSSASASLYDYNTIVLCDMKYNLFTYGTSYNPINFSHTQTLSECGNHCTGSFSTHVIPHTNLILVITDGTCSCDAKTTNTNGGDGDESNGFNVDGERFDYSNNCPPRAAYDVRPPEHCIDFNSATNKERNINQECGGASNLRFINSIKLLNFAIVLVVLTFRI